MRAGSAASPRFRCRAADASIIALRCEVPSSAVTRRAVIRGVTRTDVKAVGNFWVDMTRSLLYVLLPVSIVIGLFLVAQGIPQNFHEYTNVTSVEGFKQAITQGPMASQEAIK